ncbi:MAG: hypothetical protein IKQ37_07335 [Bacteroidaceae bacterium]|nr:hypothetical protein [Bacteroidaceae bacterium]
MRRPLLLLLSLVALGASAQDVIVKKDGTPILTKVLEVNTDNVKYKKHGNQDGPTYTIAISDILSLTYANGDKEDFGNVSSTPAEANPSAGGNSNADASQGLIQLPPDARNAEIIRQYNKTYQSNTKHSSSKPKSFYVFWGVRENSLMSNDELEMTFETKELFEPLLALASPPWKHEDKHRTYYIKLQNKTDKTIYIDRGNCFRILSGSTYTYYNPSEQTTISNGNTTGASMNMGAVAGALGVGGVAGQLASGLNVGAAKQHSISKTYSQQRILAIPPHSFQYLTEEKYVEAKGSKYGGHILIEEAESFSFYGAKLPNISSCGDANVFTEQNTPDNMQYIITYSTSEGFSSYSCLTCNMYIKEVIGYKINIKNKAGFLCGGVKSYQEAFDGLDDFGIVGVEDDKYSLKIQQWRRGTRTK